MTTSQDLIQSMLFFSALAVTAAVFALVEIQIEGRDGWAAKLPTWKLSTRWLNRLFPGRPLTGYHFYVVIFIALVAHLPFALGLPWTRYGQLRALSFILFFWVAEDFLWFVLNPHFGLRRFRPQNIGWHRQSWWWLAPRDYWIATTIAAALYICSQHDPVIYIALRP